MNKIEGFPPIAANNAKLIVLGSMPGEVSLQKQQYYGHPRNAFWPIMQELFAMPAGLAYQQQQAYLISHGVAVWDVLQACRRTGSLDANIDQASIQPNNFLEFFGAHRDITQVFFNGGMAEKLYKKYVLPSLKHEFTDLCYHRLPSTSPAFASLTWQQKTQAWQIIKASMVK
jgi:double-stranded uracil-DNA glycosylase